MSHGFFRLREGDDVIEEVMLSNGGYVLAEYVETIKGGSGHATKKYSIVAELLADGEIVEESSNDDIISGLFFDSAETACHTELKDTGISTFSIFKVVDLGEHGITILSRVLQNMDWDPVQWAIDTPAWMEWDEAEQEVKRRSDAAKLDRSEANVMALLDADGEAELKRVPALREISREYWKEYWKEVEYALSQSR